jgi:hypothetical protein
MRLIVGFIRTVLVGLAVGGLCVLLAHLAGAADGPAMTGDFGGISWAVDLHRSDNAAWVLACCASAAGLADMA